MKRYLVLTLAVAVLAAFAVTASAEVLYENRFESDAALAELYMHGTTDHAIIPGAAPCPGYLVGANILWMYGVGNTPCSVFADGYWDIYRYSVWAKVTSNVMPYINVFFRVQETGGNWYGLTTGYCVHCRHSQNQIELQRIVNGLYTPIQTVTYDFVPGTWYNICIQAGDATDPTHIRVYVNTACDPMYELLIDAHDDEYAYGGVGVGCLSSGGTSAVVDGWFDRMLVTTIDHNDGGPSPTEATTWGGIKSMYR